MRRPGPTPRAPWVHSPLSTIARRGSSQPRTLPHPGQRHARPRVVSNQRGNDQTNYEVDSDHEAATEHAPGRGARSYGGQGPQNPHSPQSVPAQGHERFFRPTEILASDHYRGIVGDDERSRRTSRDAFDVIEQIAARRLNARRLTVIDATNLQRDNRRRRYIDLSQSASCATDRDRVRPSREAVPGSQPGPVGEQDIADASWSDGTAERRRA